LHTVLLFTEPFGQLTYLKDLEDISIYLEDEKVDLGEYLSGDDMERFDVLAKLVELLHYYSTYTKNAAKDSLEYVEQSQRPTLPMETLQVVLDLLLDSNRQSTMKVKASSEQTVMSSPSTLPLAGIKAEWGPDTLDDPTKPSSSTSRVEKDVDFLPTWSSFTTHPNFMGRSNWDQPLKPYKNVGHSVAFSKSATKVETNETPISDNPTAHAIRHQHSSEDHNQGICELVGLSSFLYARYRRDSATVDLDMAISILQSILRMARHTEPTDNQYQTEGTHCRATR